MVLLDGGLWSVFVVVDILLEQARCENCVSVQRVCSDVRRQCPLAVSTLAHYVFVYDCLHELLCTSYAWLGADVKSTYRLLSRPVTVDSRSYFAEQFDLLGRNAGDQTSSPAAGRPVTVDSYRYRDCFVLDDLASEWAAPRWTSQSRWEVVTRSRARCIVTFDVSTDWTQTRKGECRCCGSYELEALGEDDGKGAVRWNTFKLTDSYCQSALIVRHFVFTGWPRNDTVPACRRDEFIRLIR